MKKIICLTLALFAPVLAQAMPLSNIANPGLYNSRGITDCELCYPLSFRLGYYGDFVFEREIHRHLSQENNGDAIQASWYTNAAELVINFCNFMDFFGTIGQANFSVVNPVDVGIAQINTYDAATSWSVGNRACWEWCDFIWGYELQYQHSSPLRDAVIPLANGEITHRQSNNKETYNEWQGGIGAAYKLESCGYFDLVPYMGLTFSGLRWNQSRTSLITGQKMVYRQAKIVGYSVGATALLGNTIGLTAEARFASETALYVSGQMRF